MIISCNFKSFYKEFNFNDMQIAIEFYSIFSGAFSFCEFDAKYSIFEEINRTVLKKYYLISKQIDEQFNLSLDEKNLLDIIANREKREFSSLKKSKINHFRAKSTLNKLIAKDILKIELSRERPVVKTFKKQKVKKEFRGYKIENRLKFKNNFLKFYFTFIYKNEDIFNTKDNEVLLELIRDGFDKYISEIFEDLSQDLIKVEFDLKSAEVGSYWDKHVEIDLFAEGKNGNIIGECKWKNTKICKNILNSLKKKCKISNIEVWKYALFSKSGFSKELLKDKEILLIDLNSFKGLLK